MAPPCGTCSRAREIDNGGPQPLRSDHWPDGLPNLGQADRARVFSANKLYTLTAKIADYCFSNGLLLVIENPARSIFG